MKLKLYFVLIFPERSRNNYIFLEREKSFGNKAMTIIHVSEFYAVHASFDILNLTKEYLVEI